MGQLSPPASSKPFTPPWQRETLGQRMRQQIWQWRQAFSLLVMAAVSLWLWGYVKQHSHFPAHAVSRLYVLSAPEQGNLAALAVEKGAAVRKGQIIGQMDARASEVDLKIAKLEKERLERLLVSSALQFRLSQVALQARLQAFVQQAQSTWATGLTKLRTTKAELGALNKELRWLNRLRKSQLGRPNNLGTLQARQKSLKALLLAMPRLLRMYRTRRAKARHLVRRIDGLSAKQAKAQIEKILRPLQAQWAMQTLRIKKLELQRQRLILRAPVDGVVQEVLQRPGTRLLQGAPVLRITCANQGTIMAYVDQTAARRIQPDMTVQVSLRYPKMASLKDQLKTPKSHCARVTAVGTIEPIPVRYRQIPNKPSWVRPVSIQLHKPHPLIPGEQLIVDFTAGPCKPTPTTSKQSPTTPSRPRSGQPAQRTR